MTKKFGEFFAVNNVSFNVEDGKFFSILGPSGCGKTTLLRTIAGFYEPTQGNIKINGNNMVGVEANKRPVNLVFQNLALFPMMNVHENIAFGLRRRGIEKREVNRKVSDILERVGLPGFEKKKINQISGGQKQRIAIARCLVLEPSVLLLDEPLGALDAKLREHMKVELKKLQLEVGTTFVYITHDQSEAMVMSDHVAVMNSGEFEQVDSPQNLYHYPKSSFVAQFVGNNNKLSVQIHKKEGSEFYARYIDGRDYMIDGYYDAEQGDNYDLFLRPEAIIINPVQKDESFNVMRCTVKAILFDGANSQLLVIPENTSEELTVAMPQTKEYDYLKKDDIINIGWNPSTAVCFRKADVKIYDDV